MRIVARLPIATTILLSTALAAWAQPPGVGKVPSGNTRAQAVSQPSFTPPDEVTGAWIDDSVDDATESSDSLAPVQPPEQLGIEPFEIDQSLGGGDGCDCEACRGGGGDPGARHGGGLCEPLWCSDMWNEVHAHRRIYAQVDYLSLWSKGNSLPPLVTTSPLGTPQSQAGVLPVSATTEILFGNGRVDDGQRNGGRINLGYWLVDGEFLGVEGQYFALQQGNTTFNGTSDFSGGDPNAIILARPFTNVGPSVPSPTQDSVIVAYPDGFNLSGGIGTLDGTVRVQTTSNLQSANALLRKLIWIDFTMQRRLDLLLGYRFLRLDDSVTIQDASLFVPSSGPIPQVLFQSEDIFSASNQFHGGEIGLKGQSQHGRLGFEFVTKVAFGNNRQTTYINGSNTITSGGFVTESAGGFLTQPTNIGTYQRNVFAILPEADINLKYDITCNLRATVGYMFLYMNRVQRSGDAINTNVNPTQLNGGTLSGQADPVFSASNTTWWAQGITVGAEYRW